VSRAERRRAFTPSRADGRSDRRVVYELVQDAEPGDVFTYDSLIEALSEGLDETVSRHRAQAAVRAANRTYLQERRRYLTVVADVGYRVIRSDEQLPVALGKKARAQTYLKRGMEILQHVRMDELTPSQRVLHEGQLMILGGLYHATAESFRRHDKSEKLIADLTRRVDGLENTTTNATEPGHHRAHVA
jgi:hypothetical protein